MSSPVEQIKERLNIADLVGSYVKLERAGASLKGRCPFHNERTPSFFVSPMRNSYYCFGCGAKGDIFTFVQEFEGLDFIGALRILASRAGVELTRIDPKTRSEHARLFLVLEKATRFFERQLFAHSEVQKYLSGRGLLPETIKTWRVGFALPEWRALREYLLKEGCSDSELEKVGLVKRARADDGTPKQGAAAGLYDTFRGRIMFPIFDSAGRVVAFSGRILPALAKDETAKYLNSPETVLFNKSSILYGFDRAKFAIRSKNAAILVEGQMDLLMCHQAGFDNSVATSGTALTEEQLGRIKRLSENLLLSFDADSAGIKAGERAVRLALHLGLNVKIVRIAEGKDPADLIATDKEKWAQAVVGAVQVIDFYLDALLKSIPSGREHALAIEKNILPLIALLPSAVEQSHFLKVIADKTGLREGALFESFKKIRPASETGTAPANQIVKREGGRVSSIERKILSIIFWRAGKGEKDGLTERFKAIAGETRFSELLKAAEAERDGILAEAEVSYEGSTSIEGEIEELFSNLEEDYLKVKLEEAMIGLTRAEKGTDPKAAEAFLKQCQELSGRLSELKALRQKLK